MLSQTDVARRIPGGDEPYRAVGRLVCGGRTALSEAWAFTSFSTGSIWPDLTCEEELYDSASPHSFARIGLSWEAVFDTTTLPKFQHLLEQYKLGERVFVEAGRALQENRIALKTDTIVHATLISALNSAKNAAHAFTALALANI